MSKLNVDFKNGQITVKSKLQKGEQLNERELAVFQQKMIRGLMRPVVRNDKKIDYSAPIGVYLKSFLQNGITKYDFFLIIAQIAEAVNKIEIYGFSYDNLLLDLDYIFINERTKEVQFVYQPVIALLPNENSNIFTLLYQMVNCTQLHLNETEFFINDFVEFLRRLPYFDTKMIEDYILKAQPQVYQQVKRQKKGDSKFLKDKLYEDPMGSSAAQGNYSQQNQQFSQQQYYQPDNNQSDQFAAHNNWQYPGVNPQNGPQAVYHQPPLDSTPPIIPGVPVPPPDAGENTTVLNDGGTSVLNNNASAAYPYLIRLSNFERVDIDKPSFRIGKEKSYVDYFVMNNSAVSRIHADIISRDGRYFIKDNNSTNRTFVNGTVIPFEQEYEIFDGDAVMLANEAFEFHTN